MDCQIADTWTECNKVVFRLFIRNSPSPTVGQKYTGHSCPWGKTTGRRPCRGNLCDTILDWEAELPPDDLTRGSQLSKQADLSICLGTTLQIIPSGTLPLLTLDKSGGKLVICNLQPTKYDDKAELVIHGYVDQVLKKTAELLGLEVPEYDPKTDPTRTETLHTFYRTPALKTRLSHLEQPEEEYIPRKRRRKLNTTPASQKKPSVKKTKKDLTNGHQPIKQEQTQVKPEQMEINEDKKEQQPNQVKQEEIENNAPKKEDPTNQVKLEQIENNADNKEEPDIRFKPEKIEHNASKKDEQPNQVKPEQIKNNADKEEQPKQIKPEQIKNNADKKEQPNQVKPEQIENKKEEPDIQPQPKEPQQPEVSLKGTKEPS
ncbi:SIRT6 [Cordylochernes scorpioides]|uniref:protein acetyllysine N-acetyltransferase n=1 Tax=Cordylochernes scorpioides TaxID=51811 RepID=A0ABY6KV77_9ARAC|nr:SIRT6 [Cordylochernes scorpioides]